MPFLGEIFNHVLTEEIDELHYGNITLSKNSNLSNIGNVTCYYKSHAIAFYNDIKSLLNQTELDIVYNDENLTFEIFNFKFKIACFSTYYSSSYYNIFPYCIFGDTPYSSSSGSTITLKDTFYVNPASSTSGDSVDITTPSYYHTNCALLSIVKMFNTRNEVNYTLHLYYNTNFICLQYISTYGAKIPLITIIKGQTPDDIDIVYASASCNSMNNLSNQEHYHTLYNASAKKYIHHSSTNVFMNTGTDGFTDMNVFPNKARLRNIGNISEYNDPSYTGLNKVYLNKFTAFGGIIKFDNVYEVSRTNQNDEYDTQFDLDAQYTINDENYYCPGDNFRFLPNVYKNNIETFSYSKCHRLLLKI